MCGIFCMLCVDQVQACAFHLEHVDSLLTNRGPDHSRIEYRDGILFCGTVLWHQGQELQEQPMVDEDVVLLFNGDLYMTEIGSDGDTRYLFELVKSAGSQKEILDVFKNLTGPFSIIVKIKSRIYFARDPLGRHSLLIGKHGSDGIFLSSSIDPAGKKLDVMELPPLGVYSFDTATKIFDLHPYKDPATHQHTQEQLDLLKNFIPLEVFKTIPLKISPEITIQDYSFDDVIQNLPETDPNSNNFFEKLLEIPAINITSNAFIELLSASVKDRVQRTLQICKRCINQTQCDHSNVGILFSGGIDCSLIAILADKFIDPNKSIDLMNVSFEKVSYAAKKTEVVNWNVPDRVTGLDTLEELGKLCPNRKWNFIEIDVTRAELEEHVQKLSSLVFPLSTVIDESIGAALYFASRGVGVVNGEAYSSSCRVILSGLGADELFGGYTRHRNAFKRSTPDRDLLAEELEMDWARLPSRNLARDDRMISDHGVTLRTPFIEENFVNFSQRLKPLQRCYPQLPEGIGDKLLLRLCAYKVGLKVCSKFRKRAIQFGSRIADKRQSAKEASKFLVRD